MSRNELNTTISELAEIQMDLREDREMNRRKFDLFLAEIKKLDEQDAQLSFKLDKAIDRIKDLMKRINSKESE